MENFEIPPELQVLSICFAIALVMVLAALLRVRLRGGRVSHCPYCTSERIRMATLQPRDEWLIRLHIIPIRCEACKSRFFAMRSVRIVAGTAQTRPAGPRRTAG